ncbi:MAG: phosphoribosylamine--glycine ligase [Thermanaerothrix sp.]|nr:phosphoribosylamine--glycine ligase [Thermanaerothrix sp.]
MILGAGGREHAVAWAVSRSPIGSEVIVAPGNGGTRNRFGSAELDVCDVSSVLKAAKDLGIDLVIPGPEAPLVAGVADGLMDQGILVLGPEKRGALLEGSKAFAKFFMEENQIPTSSFSICEDLKSCRAALESRTPPYVLKADGLASGKGVLITSDLDEAIDYCSRLLDGRLFGDAGRKVVIEDHVSGFEITALALVDGNDGALLPLSQDHKRAFDGDKGPNTGGMGAYAPVPWDSEALRKMIREEVLVPTIRGLRKMGITYRGILYMGLMLDSEGKIWVLEYNVRMGDPETQAIMPIIGNDWLDLCHRAAKGELHVKDVRTNGKSALGVVLASEGYPFSPRVGLPLEGASPFDDGSSLVFHSGTALAKDKLVSSSGRVLTVVGVGDSIEAARSNAYRRMASISLPGGFCRGDIGHSAMEFFDL